MVKQITKEEADKRWGVQTERGMLGMKFKLTPDGIQKWKDNGNFAHLKSELIGLPDVQFYCAQQESGTCVYTFFTHSEKLTDRLCNLIRDMLYGGKGKRLVEYPPKFGTWQNSFGNFDGMPKVCNLF